MQRYDFGSQRKKLHMSYLDVGPQAPNGRTVVLLHGKNFCAGTWENTIRALTQAGYRVIAPDQVGFCKSSKPAGYQYSFQQLAANTHALLEHLGVRRVILLGHSTGGMLAAVMEREQPALAVPGDEYFLGAFGAQRIQRRVDFLFGNVHAGVVFAVCGPGHF